jgi:hypothetical protein
LEASRLVREADSRQTRRTDEADKKSILMTQPILLGSTRDVWYFERWGNGATQMTNDDAWAAVKQAFSIGTRIRCRVKEHHPFGVFTTIDGIAFDGLIQITDFTDRGRVTPSEYPPIGSEVEAAVLGFTDGNRKQI